jgi:hypothetical protein
MTVHDPAASTEIGQAAPIGQEGRVNDNGPSYYEIDPWRGKSVALGEIGREGE